MLRAFKFLFLSILAVFFICFAVSNRGMVTLGLFPLPYTAEMPIFIFAAICFAMGVIAAGISLNLQMAKTRRHFSKEHKRFMAIENELKGLKAERGAGYDITARP